jgi:hypothetical protein
MLKTIRTLNESKITKSSLREQLEYNQQTPNIDDEPEQQSSQEVKNDVTVVNDVEVKLLSTDQSDMKLSEQQQTALSQIIDTFRQQVSQIAEFEPGFTVNQNQIRLDGSIPDVDINFVLIAGQEMGLYINGEMLKLEQNVMDTLTKLVQFQLSFKDAIEPLITQRDNNI